MVKSLTQRLVNKRTITATTTMMVLVVARVAVPRHRKRWGTFDEDLSGSVPPLDERLPG